MDLYLHLKNLYIPLEDSSNTKKKNIPAWLRNLGLAGFLFFLLKGLFWLYIVYIIAK